MAEQENGRIGQIVDMQEIAARRPEPQIPTLVAPSTLA